MTKIFYDTVIIGAGPAGLTACLYALRFRMRTLLIDKMHPGGGLAYIKTLENFPGFPSGIDGMDFAARLETQLKQYDYNFTADTVRGLQVSENAWKLAAEAGEYFAKTVIIAAGASPKRLGIPGEERLTGRGVSYCAVCDAPLFRNKDVVVIGGGNSALEEAIHLAGFARQVLVVHRRGKFRADHILQEKAAAGENISFMLNTECTEICGTGTVEEVKLKTAVPAGEHPVRCQGVFIFAGMEPNTGFFRRAVHVDEQGYIITDEGLNASARGVFACGDCRRRQLRQVVTACAEGAVAAFGARNFLEAL